MTFANSTANQDMPNALMQAGAGCVPPKRRDQGSHSAKLACFAVQFDWL
jgi:hypothetical protein